MSPCDGRVLHFGTATNAQVEQVSFNLQQKHLPNPWLNSPIPPTGQRRLVQLGSIPGTTHLERTETHRKSTVQPGRRRQTKIPRQRPLPVYHLPRAGRLPPVPLASRLEARAAAALFRRAALGQPQNCPLDAGTVYAERARPLHRQVEARLLQLYGSWWVTTSCDHPDLRERSRDSLWRW